MAELVDAHVSGACAARRAGSIPVLGTIPIEDSAGGVIHFTPPVFCLCRFGVAIIYYGAHLTNQGESRLNAFALSELVGRKWGGMLGKSSKESLLVPSGRDILGG